MCGGPDHGDEHENEHNDTSTLTVIIAVVTSWASAPIAFLHLSHNNDYKAPGGRPPVQIYMRTYGIIYIMASILNSWTHLFAKLVLWVQLLVDTSVRVNRGAYSCMCAYSTCPTTPVAWGQTSASSHFMHRQTYSGSPAYKHAPGMLSAIAATNCTQFQSNDLGLRHAVTEEIPLA